MSAGDGIFLWLLALPIVLSAWMIQYHLRRIADVMIRRYEQEERKGAEGDDAR